MVSIVHAARDLGRLSEISRVLVRHGFGEFVRRLGLVPRKRSLSPGAEEDDERRGAQELLQVSAAVRIRQVFEDLGPSFVKLGQIASTRSDVLPADVVAELKRLQDAVPPESFPEIRSQIERALGAELESVFESFNEEPLAAASVAQVHAAKLRQDGELHDVVVKVQRPGIASTIASDLDILHGLATLIERAIPESRSYSPSGLVRQFDRAITDELDFTLEAENASRFASNFEGVSTIRFPKVYRQASAKRVITLERFEGHKIQDALAAGFEPKRLARIALDAIVKQIFEDGFFHADPHPGNVFAMGTPEDPSLGLIDLGMVGRLSPRMRDLTVDVMVAAVRHDYDGIADALFAIGTSSRKVDMETFRAEVALLADKYLGKQLQDIDLSSLIRDLVGTASRFGLEIPTDFLLVGKAMMTVEGIGKELDPTLDVFEETRPFFLDLMRRRYSPERIGHQLLRRLERLSGATYNMPEQLREVLDDLRLGRLTVRTNDLQLRTTSDRLGRRIFAALVCSAMLLSGSWLLSAQLILLGGLLIAVAVVGLLAHLAGDVYRAFRSKH